MTDTRPLFTVASFAIIFDAQGRVLLCHRRDMDAWNLPGGGLEIGELPDQAACREVMEETGLEVAVERLIGVYGKPGRNELVFAFLCRVTGGILQISNESDENLYFPVDNLPPNTLYKHAERIWDAAGMQGQTGSQPLFKQQGNVRK